MNPVDAFPEYLTRQSLWLFALHFTFVALVFSGQYFLCLRIQERKKIFGCVLVESFFFIPFFLSPLSCLFAWLEWGNAFYGVVQALFVLLGLAGLYRARRRWNPRGLKAVGLTEWILYGLIFTVGVFGWLVPIPDNWNGHGHVLWNVLTRMLHTGGYDFLPRSALSADDIIQLFFPPHFTFFLRWYCLNHPLFFYRSAFLVTMIVGCLLVRVAVNICKIFNLPKEAGLLGLLAVFGTYFNAMILYEVQYDLLSLLMLLYAIYLFGKMAAAREAVWSNFAVLLVFAFLIRAQIFVILLAAACLFFLVYCRRLKGLGRVRPVFLSLAFLPLLLWLGIAWVRYDHPLWPLSRGVVERIYQKIGPGYPRKLMIAPEEIPVVAQAQGEKDRYGARTGYFMNLLQPIRPFIEKVIPGILFFIRAGPLALSLACLFFILLFLRKIKRPENAFLVVEGLLILGWLVEYVVLYWGHNKFPQYLAAMTFLPAGLMLFRLQQKFFRALPVLLAGLFLFEFNVFLFGHGNIGFTLEPARILLGRRTFIEKLAYKSNRGVEETETMAMELDRAYRSGRKILHMDVEPGGLLPSLMGKEFFWEMLYFNPIDYPLRDLLTAKNKGDFAEALRKRNIGFIFFPQRSREMLDRHPLFQALAKIKRDSRHLLIVPVEEVLAVIRFSG
ncbi:MAG: hypothetical protein HY609_06520 [Deltaproteobacteria bacterium]|nr:hypothetical protein [Deltaproteobacteria bacterium]MBI4224572.1 hypothetical protein [Deltaproteobacteria bacterium]